MSRRAPIKLPPSAADLALARLCARLASSGEERTLNLLTVLADEKTVAAGTLLYWAGAQLGLVRAPARREANRMALSVAAGTLLPHLLKHVFARERPDRTVARGRSQQGIPRSGAAWDSFPSGHAINIGAIAGPLARSVPAQLRPAVWPVLALLAASRVLLLAHYPSDVAAGLGVGVMIDRASGRLLASRTARRTLQPRRIKTPAARRATTRSRGPAD